MLEVARTPHEQTQSVAFSGGIDCYLQLIVSHHRDPPEDPPEDPLEHPPEDPAEDAPEDPPEDPSEDFPEDPPEDPLEDPPGPPPVKSDIFVFLFLTNRP